MSEINICSFIKTERVARGSSTGRGHELPLAPDGPDTPQAGHPQRWGRGNTADEGHDVVGPGEETKCTAGICCSSSCFPTVGVRLVIRYSAVRLLLLFCPSLPMVGLSLITFLTPLPFLDLSSDNPPNLAVAFLIFSNLLVSLTHILKVISDEAD